MMMIFVQNTCGVVWTVISQLPHCIFVYHDSSNSKNLEVANKREKRIKLNEIESESDIKSEKYNFHPPITTYP